jgi:NAD(P)-dependent dehydrogenase (short-subunit alcohol dehydrogenase family)
MLAENGPITLCRKAHGRRRGKRMRRCVVSGANRGMGYEFVRQLLARGDRVVGGVRQPGRTLELNELAAAHPGHLHVLPLDVARPGSIEEFAREAATLIDGLDLLINNAGVLHGGERFGRLEPAHFETSFRVNALGPLLLTEALAPMLHKGERPVVANMSSQIGSIAQTHGFRTPSYAIGKAAQNMVTRQLAAALHEHGVSVLALHPGWVRTAMGGDKAPLTATEAVTRLLRVIDDATPERSGMFVDGDGKALPW